MLTTKELFERISSKCGNLDTSAVKGVYTAMARVMLEELKNGECIRFPKLGTFEVRSYSEKKSKTGFIKYIYFLPEGTLDFYINS